MPEFRSPDEAWVHAGVLTKSELDRFDESILGLGELTKRSHRVEAIAAVFDLEGFTHFCKQIDPHLSVPLYLSRFLAWLIKSLKEETVRKEHSDRAELWHPLPFFLKFLGDGLLILWDSDGMSGRKIQNLIVSLKEICVSYRATLLNELKKEVVDPPPLLRCGVARGAVFSVGNNADYVGSCINMAARLQRLPGVTFAFNVRGVAFSDSPVAFFKDGIVVQRVTIRGIGDGELIAILKKDLEKMDPADRKLFKDP